MAILETDIVDSNVTLEAVTPDSLDNDPEVGMTPDIYCALIPLVALLSRLVPHQVHGQGVRVDVDLRVV